MKRICLLSLAPLFLSLSAQAAALACDSVDYAELKDMKKKQLEALFCENKPLPEIMNLLANPPRRISEAEKADWRARALHCDDQQAKILRVLKNKFNAKAAPACPEKKTKQ